MPFTTDNLDALEICTGVSAATWSALAELCRPQAGTLVPLPDAAWAELRSLDWAETDDADGIAATEDGAHALALARSTLAHLIALHDAERDAGELAATVPEPAPSAATQRGAAMKAREVNPIWKATEEAGWRFLIYRPAGEPQRLLILSPQVAEMVEPPTQPLPLESPYWAYKNAQPGSDQEREMADAIEKIEEAWKALGFIVEAVALDASTIEPAPSAARQTGRL